MTDRDQKLAQLLPELQLEINGDKFSEELFMHNTLRPILKFQHSMICSIFKAEQHLNIELLSGKQKTLTEKRSYLIDFLQKNNKLKHRLLGTIIGLFTTEALNEYFQMRREIDKRINEMLITRFLSEFESDE
jgi:hypothetical protein